MTKQEKVDAISTNWLSLSAFQKISMFEVIHPQAFEEEVSLKQDGIVDVLNDISLLGVDTIYAKYQEVIS